MQTDHFKEQSIPTPLKGLGPLSSSIGTSSSVNRGIIGRSTTVPPVVGFDDEVYRPVLGLDEEVCMPMPGADVCHADGMHDFGLGDGC